MSKKKNKKDTEMRAGIDVKEQYPQPATSVPAEQQKRSFYTFISTHHSLCFCIVISAIITLFGFYLHQSNKNLKDAQQGIVKVYDDIQKQTINSVVSYINQSAEHRNSLQSCVDRQINCLSKMLSSKDSLQGEDIFIKLYADVEYMRGQNEYITRLVTDSLSLQYRELTSAVTTEKMLELHLGKIEHEYTNITIWAAVLTIVFLIFSFFSLFKIEQSRKEIEEIRDHGHLELNKTVENMNNIYNQCTSKCQGEIDSYKAQIADSYKAQFEELIDQYRKVIEAIKDKENK